MKPMLRNNPLPHADVLRRRDPLLRHRSVDEPELMDDPACDPVALDNTYRLFGVINPLVASWWPVYRRYVRPTLRAAAREGRPGTVLDIGCGGGDVARAITRWAARDGLDVRITGIDPDARATRWAAAHDRGVGATYRTLASHDLVAAGERYDAVISNHMLHHLTREELSAVLADSRRLTRGVAVHNDLRRSRAAWLLYWVATLPLARARVFVRFDGLLSIRRSYRPGELRQALPPGWRAVQQRFFRLLAVHTGQDTEPVQADRDQVDTPQQDRTQSDPGRTS
nr:class I SAM-dependent methyltransferase [Kocuria sp.]